MRGKLDKPIAMAREVILKHSLSERFVEAFTRQIALNSKFDYSEPERLEPCLGCSAELSNIKLWKQCLDNIEDDVDPEGHPRPQCAQCYCRPMWLVPLFVFSSVNLAAPTYVLRAVQKRSCTYTVTQLH
ncbi:unnamed protein product [Gongylonema pulchrum]|uniref:Uncharacterized protein n=1 Tax=Gongylonema pulchrum TaxID=637853 RepID=A0A3P7RY11_9BILA|nr:unnamed protein product [Gongylonema pulchrum]